MSQRWGTSMLVVDKMRIQDVMCWNMLQTQLWDIGNFTRFCAQHVPRMAIAFQTCGRNSPPWWKLLRNVRCGVCAPNKYHNLGSKIPKKPYQMIKKIRWPDPHDSASPHRGSEWTRSYRTHKLHGSRERDLETNWRTPGKPTWLGQVSNQSNQV